MIDYEGWKVKTLLDDVSFLNRSTNSTAYISRHMTEVLNPKGEYSVNVDVTIHDGDRNICIYDLDSITALLDSLIQLRQIHDDHMATYTINNEPKE